MKLLFNKNADNEVTVKIAVGTVAEEFSYTEMIKQLLKKNQFEDNKYTGLSADERQRIEEMLEKINEAIEEDDDE